MKKKIILLMLMITCLSFIVGCNSKNSEDEEEYTKTLDPEKVEETIVVLKENTDYIGNVTFDDVSTRFEVYPTEEGFIEGMTMVMDSNEINIEAWDQLIYQFQDLSNHVGSVFPDDSVPLMLKDPYDAEQILLMLVDGQVIYNFKLDD